MNAKTFIHTGFFGLICLALLVSAACGSQSIPTVSPKPLESSTTSARQSPTLQPSGAPQSEAPQPTVAASPTKAEPVAAGALQPEPTKTLAATLTDAPTATPIPTLPSLAGAISNRNYASLKTLAVWGQGSPSQLGYSAGGRLLLVETSVGRYAYDAQSLAPQQVGLAAWDYAVADPAIPSMGGPVYELRRVSCGHEFCPGSELFRDNAKVATVEIEGTYAFSPDGTLLAGRVMADSVVQIYLWKTATGDKIGQFDTLAKVPDGGEISCMHEVLGLAFSPDSRLLASACDRNSLYLWDVASMKMVHSLPEVGKSPEKPTFSPDGSLLAAALADGALQVWDVSSGELRNTLEPDETQASPIKLLAFRPDNQALLLATRIGDVLTWELGAAPQSKTVITSLTGWDMAFSPDGNLLAVGREKLVRLLRVNDSTLLDTLTISTNTGDFVDYLAFSADGKSLVVLRDSARIDVFRLTGERFQFLKQLRADQLMLVTPGIFAFHPDGKRLAVVQDGKVMLYNLSDLSAGGTIRGPQVVTSVAFAPDGQSVAVSSGGQVQIRSVENGKQLDKFDLPESALFELQFSPDGKYLLAWGLEKDYLVETKEWKVVYDLDINPKPAFSLDGTVIFTGGEKNVVALIQVRTGNVVYKLEGHQDGVAAIAISADGSLLATSAPNDRIRLWGIPK